MNKQIEALKLALEALEHEADKGNDDAYKVERDAIKEALAQPEQEPVAWIYSQGTAKVASMSYVSGVRATPLYTSPPQRKPLTDEEIEDIWADCPADWDDKINVLTLARAIEAAHGIKENT